MSSPTSAVLASIPRGVAPGVAGEPDLRVRLVAGATSVNLSSVVRMVWVAPLNGGRAPARMSGPVRATLGPGGWELTDASGLTARFDRAAVIAISAEEGTLGTAPVAGDPGAAPVYGRTSATTRTPSSVGSAVIVNGKPYPGLITLTSSGGGSTFDVIDRINMEDYLRGVVAAEMYPGWPLTAYQTQAVAARSYALTERARARAAGIPFDLEAGVKDQAFAASDNPLITRAVTETRGVILNWHGGPLRAYYSSTCGGRPASARDTWPASGDQSFNLAGPLQGSPRDHACQQAPQYKWTVSRPRREIVERFKAYGRTSGSPLKHITGIDSIRSGGVNGSGRTNSFLVVQPGGQTLIISGEELRRAANQEVPGLPPVTPSTRVHASDTDVVVTSDRVVFTGRGLGHGVGMCQWCTKGFAEKGETWQAILTKFYPGARLERVY